jgi:DUF1365 family protein
VSGARRELRSCVYEARLAHARTRPVAHRFAYPVWQLLVDLDELPELAARLRLFSYNRPNLVALHDADHAAAAGVGLRAALVAFLGANGVDASTPGWRFLVLTQARVCGFVFNPVTFSYCHAPDGALACVVAEVRNTFGKVHRYLLDERARVAGVARGRAYDADKLLHVSPFFDLELGYRFHFRELGARLDLAMDVTPPGRDLIFHARLAGERRPLTDATLARLCIRYPLSTVQVVARIHWQALRLWLAGASFHAEPAYDPDLARRRHDRSDPLARAARCGPADAAAEREAGAPAGTGRPRASA